MNIFNIFDDYEKKYHNWLQDKNVKSWYHPNQIVGAYQGSGIEQGLLSTRDTLWGQKPRDIPGQPPIHQLSGTQGWLGTSGQAPNLEGFKRGKLVSNLKQAGGTISEQTLGSPIGFGEGQVDPGLAAGVKSQYGITQKIFSTEGRVGGEWKKKGIDLYNSVASEHFSKFAIRDKNGKIVKRNGKIQLNNEGKNQLESSLKELDQTLPPQLGGSSTVAQAEAFTGQDAESLSKFAGVNLKDVKKNWAKKGGFDGLMANPAFTLGLALMQSSAQGKSIGSGAMDNFIKAAGISEHYKDRLKARRNIMGPVSDDQRAMAASALPTGIQLPGAVEGFFGDGDELRGHNSALNKIYLEVRKQFDAKDWDYSKGEPVMTEAMFNKAYNKLLNEKKINKVKGKLGVYLSTDLAPIEKGSWEEKETAIWDFFKKWGWDKPVGAIGGFINPTPGRAEGGPVQAGQPYVVGEKGPEVVVPKANANVVSNDDSQVMSMLLASNPQLQNVSRPRAESILRSRFPDYFA